MPELESKEHDKQQIRLDVLPPLHLRPRSKEEQSYFAKQSGSFVVPDIGGIEKPAAIAHIQGAGLKVGKITSTYHDKIKKGFVVSTTPDKGTEVTEGSPVDVVLSYGPKDAPVDAGAGLAPLPNPRMLGIPDPTMAIQYELPKPE